MTSFITCGTAEESERSFGRALAVAATSVWPLAFSTIAIIQLALIWTHEPWLDELQAVLLARDTHGLSDWYWNFRYEGHAPLWPVLLKLPLTIFGEVTSLRIVQSAFALATAWLIYVRSPFGNGVKLLLGLNYFILFEFGVIARDYSLAVCLVLAFVAFRRRPIAWVLIALLPQAGAQGILLAGICSLVMLTERRWSWTGMAQAAAGVVLAFAWIIPAPDFQASNGLQVKLELAIRVLRTLRVAGGAILPMDWNAHLVGWTYGDLAFLPVLVTGGLVLPFLAMWAVRRQPVFCLAAGLFALATYMLSISAYALSLRHFGLIVVLVIGLLWIEAESQKTIDRVVLVWFALLALGGVAASARSFAEPFSPTSELARFIADETAPSRVIIPADTMLGVEVSATLQRPTYNVTNDCMQTFVRWKGPVFMPPLVTRDEISYARTLEEARDGLAKLKAAAARAGGRALLILDDHTAETLSLVADDPALRFRRYIHVGSHVSRLDRTIYELDVPAEPDAGPIPHCAP